VVLWQAGLLRLKMGGVLLVVTAVLLFLTW
jgi:hypothetical protein